MFHYDNPILLVLLGIGMLLCIGGIAMNNDSMLLAALGVLVICLLLRVFSSFRDKNQKKR